MRIAVLNASGAQAHAIADALSTDHVVSRLSRRGGPDLIAVDPASEDALVRALDGHEAVVWTSPIDHRPGVREAYAARVARACERAGVARLILNTAGPVADDNPRPVADVLRSVTDTVLSGATPATVVRPTIYLDNLVAPWSLPAVVNEGLILYPIAPNTPVSWISHRDLGRFVAAVIADPDAAGRVYDIGGETRTPVELAAVVAGAAERPVAYVQTPLDAFAAGLNAGFGAPAGDDIAGLYEHLAERPHALVRDAAVWTRFGLQPESIDAWAGRQTWSVVGSA